VALLGIGVLVIAVIALRHPGNQAATAGALTHKSSTAAASPATSAGAAAGAHTSTAARTSPAASSAPAKLPLVVLNSTSTVGLAQVAAARFQAGGWTVTGTGNLANSIISTCAYYDPTVAGAQAAATALRAQFPAIARVAPKFSGLPAGPIVVVLTSDYPAS
jgi:hypothetical protein